MGDKIYEILKRLAGPQRDDKEEAKRERDDRRKNDQGFETGTRDGSHRSVWRLGSSQFRKTYSETSVLGQCGRP